MDKFYIYINDFNIFYLKSIRYFNKLKINKIIFFSAEYEVGTPAPSTPCSFIVNSTIKRNGTILSPTYPGTYPKDLLCTYKFIGNKGQRIRLEFRDFDLFFGGPQYVYIYNSISSIDICIQALIQIGSLKTHWPNLGVKCRKRF